MMDFHLPDGWWSHRLSLLSSNIVTCFWFVVVCVLVMTAANNILTFLVFVPIITITRHNEQTSPIRSNPHAPSLQRYSHRGRQFIVDCCVLSQHGSHLRPRPHPSLPDEPSLQPGYCYCCCCLLAPLLWLLLPPCPAAVATAATAAVATSPDCCRYCCCCCLRAQLLRLLLLLAISCAQYCVRWACYQKKF